VRCTLSVHIHVRYLLVIILLLECGIYLLSINFYVVYLLYKRSVVSYSRIVTVVTVLHVSFRQFFSVRAYNGVFFFEVNYACAFLII